EHRRFYFWSRRYFKSHGSIGLCWCYVLLRFLVASAGALVVRDWNYENDQWMKVPVHLMHLPPFSRHFVFVSFVFRVLWAIYLKLAFTFYIRLEVKGDFVQLYKTQPRLLLISNHASHLDAVSIAAAVPFRFWKDLYISAAK